MNDLASQSERLINSATGHDATAHALVAYDWRRLAQFDDPPTMWLAVGAGFAGLTMLAIWSYRRERNSLSAPVRWLLSGLRIVAIAALILYFLGPEKRIDRKIQTESEVVIVVDTSQSMSVADEPTNSDENKSRLEAIKNALVESAVIDDLRAKHNVSLSIFDSDRNGIVSWPRTTSSDDATSEAKGLSWQSSLVPQGSETQLGTAIREVVTDERAGPLAGIILFSDGGSNSGLEPLDVADFAKEQEAPIFAVGVGSEAARRNLRIQELSVPERIYPNDRATVSCIVHNEGFAGRTCEVELYLRDASVTGAIGQRIDSKAVTFTEQGEMVPVEFDFEPAETGRLAIEVRIAAPPDDQQRSDNSRQAEVDVVESGSRVLLIASGAARDYRFLRNQLRRDPHMDVDVWLQMAPSGISQDADRLLISFPDSKEELYEYDCIVAFDPDWTLLDARQVDLLQSWVAEDAGGLVVIAGPIHTASWLQSPEHIAVRSLYPVEFQKRLTLLDDGLYGSDVAWPLEFSRDGEDSDFLWLANTASESQLIWSEFEGVYGCYAVKGPKPGARVLARYSDPEVGISTERPVYLAEHFYGAGRVVYLGSSEMWRLRSLGVEYFEVLYTQLIRHVSQGRLLRGSKLGRLLVPKENYTVGDDVVVRAQVYTESREPLIADKVTARVFAADGTPQSLPMVVDPERDGNFTGQFSVTQEGSYRVELAIPNTPDEQLVQRIHVTAPNLEFAQTRRNADLLAAIATRSGGAYYQTVQSAIDGSASLPPVAAQIENRSETRIQRGTPDQDFAKWLNRSLLAVITSALSAEWILRRLTRLA